MPERFSLSPKACQGILRRAEKRGKELPQVLKVALERQGFRPWQGAAGTFAEGAGASGCVCLNDQGGSRMDVTHEMTATLRAEAHHPPCILGASGFCTEHSANSRGIGYEDERAPTLRAGVVPGVAIDFNPTDSRIRISDDGVCQTLCSRMGTSGNQVPLVFGLSSDQSRAMLSDNPHAGIYEAKTSRTLDTSGSSPQCHQGGMLVVAPAENPCYCLQGSMIGRKEENGPQGDGINREVAFTLDTSDRHAVYAMTTGSFTQVDQEKSPPLMARDYKDPPLVGRNDKSSEEEGAAYAMDRACFSAGQNAQYSINIGKEKVPTLTAQDPGAVTAPETGYIVRRLTPRECCRLQGYPDGWTEQLGTETPTDEEIRYWAGVFGEWYRATGKTAKAPSRNRIVKWLRDPRTDSAEYKAYGNSVCVYCVFFVLAGIVWAEETEEDAN